MTLLELLVKELPKRGGWPEGAVECFIHEEAEDYGYFYTADGGGCGRWIDAKSVKYVQNCSGDTPGYNVTREQYEAAISAQQTAWNGEGLPPVGVMCEVKCEDHADYGWVEIHVVHVHNGEVIGIVDMPGDCIHDGIGKYSPGYNRASFRAVRTKAERRRESVVDDLVETMIYFYGNPKGAESYKSLAERIFDAVAIGKIPGVRLSDA